MKVSSVFNASVAKKLTFKTFVYGLIIAIFAQFTACGTILYPDRKGTISGQVDPAVAIMDGLGLLLFLIPGVIAFAVDFSNGCIYLPHGKRAHLSQQELQSIKVNNKVDREKLNQLLSQKLGQKIDVQADGTRIQQMSGEAAVLANLNAQGFTLAARN